MLTNQVDLNVSPGGIPPVIHVSQYDAGTPRLELHLVSDTGEFTIPSGAQAEIRGTKPDGNGFSYSCNTMGSSTVVVTVTEQMTAAAGKVICEIALYTGTSATEAEPASQDFTQLCTANFVLFVERAALDKDTLKSGSEIRQLVTVIDRTDELLAAAQTMDDAKQTIQDMTDTTRVEFQEMMQQAQDDATALVELATEAKNGAEKSEANAEKTLETVQEKGEQISRIALHSDTLAQTALEKATNVENENAETGNQIDSLKRNLNALTLLTQGKVDDAYVEDGFLYMTADGEVVVGPLGPFSGTGGGGGGGSSGNNAKITLENTSGFLSRTIAQGDTLPVSIRWASLEDEIPTGNGTMKITVGGITKALMDIQQGNVTVDIAPFVSAGSSVVKMNVSDIYGNSRTLNFSITVVILTLTSSFDDSVAYNGPISFPYTPTGSIQKTMHFLVDDNEIGTAVTSVSGRQQSFTIPQQEHGAHSFRCYFEADINGQQVKSNELYYELICLENLHEEPIVTCSFHEESVKQYTTIHIGYAVYNPASINADVAIIMNGSTVSSQTVGRGKQDFSMRMDKVGTYEFEIRSGEVSRSFTLEVEESDIHVEAETEAMALYLTSQGRSNGEENRSEWKYGNIHAQLTGFNFTSDGWQQDTDGNRVLRVAGDARVSIPYRIFAEDFRTSGKTIELEFATRTVMNYDALILSCLSGDRGITLTSQKVVLKSEQSEIGTQFKENEHVRITFVVQKRTEYRLILCYINGIMSGAVQYPVNDDFAQTEPVGISIGSNECTIDLYNIRVYDNDLTRSQVLDNWIADTQDVNEMLSRFQRNRVYDAYGNIVKEQLPSDLPYMIIEAAELPQYKGDKKTVSGSYVDTLHPERCFSFTGAQFDVQGTSSQYYERKNYKGKYRNGFVMANGSTIDDWKLRDDSIPVNVFCFKADVASSEGANNVELARLYDMACPYKTPAQQEDERIRQGIDGYPIVLFWHDTVKDETRFMGKYNWNNDKSTEEVFGFKSGDESWEIKNNTGNRVLFKSADYEGDAWLNDFEARYPDTEPPYTDPAQLQEFAAWLVTTDTEAATGNALPNPVTYGEETFTEDTAAYRLAKFKAEAGDYMEMQSAMFFYLFTELFLMVDNRAKNMFPSFIGSKKS